MVKNDRKRNKEDSQKDHPRFWQGGQDPGQVPGLAGRRSPPGGKVSQDVRGHLHQHRMATRVKRLILEGAAGSDFSEAVAGKNEMMAQLREKSYQMLAQESIPTRS